MSPAGPLSVWRKSSAPCPVRSRSCVTHLPQIAALADTHFRIAKAEHDGRTFTSVTPLDFEGRKAELARIIGGASITPTTLQSAAEMLESRT